MKIINFYLINKRLEVINIEWFIVENNGEAKLESNSNDQQRHY